MDLNKYQEKLDFMEHYIEAQNASTGSKYDPNSNIATKNIATLEGEIYKKDAIGINRAKMVETLTKLYGKEIADKYIEQLSKHEVYRNDETGLVGKPYTYSAKESLVVELNGEILSMSFDDLYEECPSPEILIDEENEVYQKIPKNLYVYDRDGKTEVTHLTKKKNKRKLMSVKTQFGEDIIVTDNHPLIISDDKTDTVVAEDSLGKQQYRTSLKLENAGTVTEYIPKGDDYGSYKIYKNGNYSQTSASSFKLNEKFGYVVGFFVAEGWFRSASPSTKHDAIMIKVKDREILQKACNYLYESTGVCGRIFKNKDCRNFYTMIVDHPLMLDFFLDELSLGFNAPNKRVPRKIFQYPIEFMNGFLAGLTDGDGTIASNGIVSIRLSSRACISQLSYILNYLGVNASMTWQDTSENPDHFIQSNYPMFGISFHAGEHIRLSEKYNCITPKYKKYETEHWSPIINVREITNKCFLADNEYIYDITTKSNTFVLNNLWVHNCVSLTMYPFLMNGLKDLGGSSEAPKHLYSFAGAFTNLIFAVSAQFCGACLHPSQSLDVAFLADDTMHYSTMLPSDLFKNLYQENHEQRYMFKDNKDNIWEAISLNGIPLRVKDEKGYTLIKTVFRRAYKGEIYTLRFKVDDKEMSVKVTGDHKFKYPDGSFVPASAVCVGDPIMLSRRNGFEVKSATIIEHIYHKPNDCDYVYEIETESHTYSVNGLVCHNCATPEFFPYFDYFARKDFGDDYYLRPDEIVELGTKPRTIKEVIEGYFQQIIYTLNQPASARNYQSPFPNFAYFDKYYFDGLFHDFVFPDGSKMCWESTNWLQKTFMEWFNKERTHAMITFPVETISLLTDGEKPLDSEWEDFAAEMWAKGHSFFMYNSNSVDSLSSCCYSGDTNVLVKGENNVELLTFKELAERKCPRNGWSIFNNGKWSKGKLVKLPFQEMYELTTAQNKKIKLTWNHRNNCLGGMKLTKDLTCDDYIMLSTTPLDELYSQQHNLSYEQGFLIGSFLGDGCFDSTICNKDGTECIYDTIFSLPPTKEWLVSKLEKALRDWHIESEIHTYQSSNNNLFVRIFSKELPDIISEWTNWQRGTYFNNKELNMNCLFESIDFRQGIVDGWYSADGTVCSDAYKSFNCAYTTSKRLVECMDALCVSLGYTTALNVDDRKGEIVLHGEIFSKNYDVYCLTRHQKNKHAWLMKDYLIFRDNCYYAKIKEIKPIDEKEEFVYCFEMLDQTDDKFTLPNGIHNYNCRLKNEIVDNEFSHTLGAGGVATGSKCVMTININRLVQNADRNGIPLKQAVAEQTELIHKYLYAVDHIIRELYDRNMLPVYSAGFISLDKQYLTIGLNGLLEGAEYLGLDTSSDSQDYRDYVETIVGTISDLNKKARTKHIMYNIECIPAESLGVKNARWDREDGYFVPRDCYNSYMYKVEDSNTNVIDKLILHGKDFTGKMNGGSACHINLDEHLTAKQYKQLIRAAIKTGCNYFTFNIPNTICNDCDYITKEYLEECPKCGSHNLDYATRVIGYLVRISKMSKDRQEEAHRRFYDNKKHKE